MTAMMANITLSEEFTNTNVKKQSEVDHTVKQMMLLMPSIQFSINQMIHTATQVSPHMLIYGTNLRDTIDFKLANKLFDELPTKFDTNTKFELVEQIKLMIALERKRKDENHSKYVLKMKENYDISKFPDTFKVGDIVAYHIGDLAKTNKKLHKRFIGPCEIIERITLNKGQDPLHK